MSQVVKVGEEKIYSNLVSSETESVKNTSISSDKYLIAFPNKAKSVMEKSRREGSLYSQDCKLSIGSGSGNPRRSFRKVAGIDGPKISIQFQN